MRSAIARELEGVSRKGLALRAAATTTAYRSGGTSATAIRSAEDALAYALARLPATYAACAAVFAEAQRMAPAFLPERLLDAGSGPGGGSWAALETFTSLSAVAWLDASRPFLELAARLAAEGPAPLKAARSERTDLTATGELPAADLVMASYALAEIPTAEQAPLVRRLWSASQGMLVLVEPGTPGGYARILAARETLIAAGASVLAPCPHHASCPLPPGDWCHFSVRLPRSRDHRLAKGAEVPFEDEKFSYLIAARPQVTAAQRRPRVLAPPRAGKPGIELRLCGAQGVETRFIPRRDKAGHAQARRLDWGDAFEA